MNRCPDCGRDAASNACAACGYRAGEIDGFTAYAPGLAYLDTGYDPAYFAAIAELEAGSFWFRARNRLLLRLLARYAPGTCDYLEIGCGTGYVLEAVARRFPHWRLSGSEIQVAGLGHAAARVPGATLFQMDARRAPFRTAFDVVGAYDVIEHIDDDRAVLRAIHGALRPGGLALFAVPQHRWLWSEQDRLAHHVRRYARGELESKARDAGFVVEWSGSYLTLLLPLVALSRRRRRARGGDRDPLAELRLPRALDRVLDAVMRIEGATIAAGVRWPIGGSRVVVARRTLPGDDRLPAQAAERAA